MILSLQGNYSMKRTFSHFIYSYSIKFEIICPYIASWLQRMLMEPMTN